MNPAGVIEFSRRPAPPISNGKLGMMLLVGTETILFACFISAYIVLRMTAMSWPPMGTPHLSLGLSSVNTLVLAASSLLLAMGRPWRLSACFALGNLFLILQGMEFYRLYNQGLTLQSGSFGAIFYCLISLHGFHVLGGLGFLMYLLINGQSRKERTNYAEMYWHFVTAVWLILFSILYVV